MGTEKWSKWLRWDYVKCPYPDCESHHDLSDFDYLVLPGDQNPVFGCEVTDEGGAIVGGCRRKFQVVAVDRPVLVRVRPVDDDAAGFSHTQTEEERKAFEQTEAWANMQKKR